MFRDVIDRELQVIGEAVMQLDKRWPDLAAEISDRQRIIGFRHVLVHGYDVVDPKIVWDVLIVKLPILQSEAERLRDGLAE